MSNVNNVNTKEILIGGEKFTVQREVYDFIRKIKYRPIDIDPNWREKVEPTVRAKVLYGIMKIDEAHAFVMENYSKIDFQDLLQYHGYRVDVGNYELFERLLNDAQITPDLYALLQVMSGELHDEKFFNKYLVPKTIKLEDKTIELTWFDELIRLCYKSNQVMYDTMGRPKKVPYTLKFTWFLKDKILSSDDNIKQQIIDYVSKSLPIFSMDFETVKELLELSQDDPAIKKSNAQTLIGHYWQTSTNSEIKEVPLNNIIEIAQANEVNMSKLPITPAELYDIVNNKYMGSECISKLIINNGTLLPYMELVFRKDPEALTYFSDVQKILEPENIALVPFLTIRGFDTSKYIFNRIMFDQNLTIVYDTVNNTYFFKGKIEELTEEIKQDEAIKAALELSTEVTEFSERITDLLSLKEALKSIEEVSSVKLFEE